MTGENLSGVAKMPGGNVSGEAKMALSLYRTQLSFIYLFTY